MAGQRAKRSFTLLEILIVILLIGLATRAVAFQIPKLLKGESFERGVEQVISKIQLAQELMLDFDTDVNLVLIEEGKGLRVTLEPLNPVPEKIKRSLNRYSLIKGIDTIRFEEGVQGPLYFDKTLGATPRIELDLIGGGQTVKLCLRGFPSKPLKNECRDDQQEAFYPEEILSLN